MKFNRFVNSILGEDVSRQQRIAALKSMPELKPVFKFNYVTWDWKQPEPTAELERFSDTQQYPFVLETSLGSDCYFVFFSSIKLTERDCETLSLVAAFEDELVNEGKVKYIDSEDTYISYVSLEELKEAIQVF